MATKPKSAAAAAKSTAKQAPKTALALPDASVLDRLRGFADKFAGREVASANKISTKDRVFSIGGEQIGTEFIGIVVDFSVVKAYYTSKFVPGDAQSPECFAVSISPDPNDLSPHQNSAKPADQACVSCQWNKFGTADEGDRKGKACKDMRRLILLRSDELSGRSGSLDASKITLNRMDVPPTGLKNWRRFFKFAESQSLPPSAFVVRFSFDPKESKEVVDYEVLKIVDSMAAVDLIASLAEDANKLALQPWEKQDSAEAPKRQKVRKPVAPATSARKGKFT